jgi:hypothetical protein
MYTGVSQLVWCLLVGLLLHVLCSVALSGSVVVLRKELFLYLSDSEVVFVFPLITYILLWVNTACMVENQ